MTSYDMRAGLHRIDRIPEGKYVLLETRVPDGYQGVEPILITVDQTENIVRYEVENRREPEEKIACGRIRIRKTDAEDKELKLSGAWFEAVCVQTGEKTVFMTGADGIALSPELPIGYLKMVPGSCTSMRFRRSSLHPDMGVRKRRFLSYLTGKRSGDPVV